MSPRLNVSEYKKHSMCQHLLLAPEKTVVKSIVPCLLCRKFQTHPQWSRDRQGSCRRCLFSKVKKRSVFVVGFDERLGLRNCERVVQSVGHSTTLLGEGKWTDIPKEVATKERWTNQVKV